MLSQRKLWPLLALAGLLLVGSADAQLAPKGVTVDDTKWMLPDAEAFLKINVKQMMASDLMTKRGIAALKDAIKNNEQLKGVLEATDLDITKDIDSIMVSGSGKAADDAKVLAVVRGKFDVAKIQAALEKASKKDDKIKIVKEGTLTLYETTAGDKSTYAAFADRNTLIWTQNKEATVTAVKEGGKKAAAISEGMKSALNRFTGKESVAMALVISPDLQKMLAGVPNVGAAASKLSTVTTAVTLTDAVSLDIAGVTGDAKSAKQLSAILDALKATGAAALAGMEEIPPVAGELLNAIKVTASKEAVHIKLDVSKEMLEKAGKGGAK